MPDVQEVFRMTTQKVRPDPGFVDRQVDHHRRQQRNRKIGAFAVAAAIGLATLVVVVFAARPDQDATTPGDRGQGTTTGPVSTVERGTYLVDLTTGKLSILPEFHLYGDHDVSPDGTMVASGEGAVSVASLDGTDSRLLAAAGGRGVRGARWSPDGRTIVYQDSGQPSERIGNLYSVDVASGEVTRLTDLEQISSHIWYMSPSFSPDGRSILFTMPTGPCSTCSPPTGKKDDQTWHLWAIPATGGEPTLVARDAGHGEYSPDGSMIAYAHIYGPDALR